MIVAQLTTAPAIPAAHHFGHCLWVAVVPELAPILLPWAVWLAFHVIERRVPGHQVPFTLTS